MNMKAIAVFLMTLPASAWAADAEYAITIKDHRFEPAEVRVPADKKVKLLIHNRDATPEEFESHDLNREKVVTPGGRITVFIGPLKRGQYPFYGEFNQDTARGVVIAE